MGDDEIFDEEELIQDEGEEDEDEDEALSDDDVDSAYASSEADEDVDPNDPRFWMNTGDTTRMWTLISQNRYGELRDWIDEDPDVAHIRSEDGRGPLWWAYEYGHKKIVKLLLRSGVDGTLTDSTGGVARDMRKKK